MEQCRDDETGQIEKMVENENISKVKAKPLIMENIFLCQQVRSVKL